MIYNLKPFKFSSHYKILNLIEENKKVLDVACASGYLAPFLRDKQCDVYGIDINIDDINEAKKYCKAEVLDISTQRVNGQYDIIILGDILEHLVIPEQVLLNLKNNLNENGYLIISIPNIVNIYPRIKIFLGFFDYEEKGIFDKSHVRFFTKKTFLNLIKNTGYQIEKLEYTPIPIYLKFSKISKFLLNPIYYFLYFLAILLPSLFAYQFVAKVKIKFLK